MVSWDSQKAEAMGRVLRTTKAPSGPRLPMEAEGRGAQHGNGKNLERTEAREVRYKNLYLCYKDRTVQHSPSR